MILDTQLPKQFRDVIDDQVATYARGRAISTTNHIPDTTEIPIENQRHWLKIPDVVCVFVDMLGSTLLGATTHDKSTAGAFQLFTGSAVRLFSEFESPYIDVRGDGAFALFDSDQPHRALAAAVTFKTFAELEFTPRVRADTGVQVGCHIGIDQKTVLVRKVGFKRYRGRSDRQNEVWAGKPVSMAAKLAAMTKNGELLTSDRYYNNLTADRARFSCDCGGRRSLLWAEVDVSGDSNFDFDTSYRLGSCWCRIHGAEYCESVLAAD
ncbi:MAG: hypothetical protein K8J08_01895 [Thermoanaerobaculia bacterium]|nr:hypothetical protein [Thermoanaerobaculia bacterium]